MNKNFMKFTLYSYFRSSCSWRVRIALALKGIRYEYVPVNLLQGDQSSEAYAQLNPARSIPALIVEAETASERARILGNQVVQGKPSDANAKMHERLVLTQSVAILEWLEESGVVGDGCTMVSLLPSDPVARARVRSMVQLIASDIQPLQNLKVLNRLGDVIEQNAAKATGDTNTTTTANVQSVKKEWAAQWNASGLVALEALVQRFGTANFCYGDALSLADVCLVPQMFSARRFGVDVDRLCPRLVAIDTRLREMEAFKLADQANQPDTK